MQFMALTRRKIEQFNDAQFAALLDPEAERVRELYAEGFCRQIWMRGDVPGSCWIIEADTEDDVREALHSLPMHQKGMLELLAVVPLRPYRGFYPKK